MGITIDFDNSTEADWRISGDEHYDCGSVLIGAGGRRQRLHPSATKQFVGTRFDGRQ